MCVVRACLQVCAPRMCVYDGHKVLAVTSRRAGRDAWRSEEEEGAEALPGSAEGSGNTSAVRERNSRRLLAAATE
ncbi:unnamed protein product [Lampetra planeri]